jgi:hypothetical protein
MGRSRTGPPGITDNVKLARINGQYNKVPGCIYTLFYGCKGCEHNMNPTLYDGGCKIMKTANTHGKQTETNQDSTNDRKDGNK